MIMEEKVYHVTFYCGRGSGRIGDYFERTEFEAWGTEKELAAVAKVWIRTQSMKRYGALSLYAKGEGFEEIYADCI